MTSKLNNILLVDDDHATNFINKMVIQKAEVTDTLTIKLNGKEAIDYLSNGVQTDKSAPPDLIFLDINMPVMDGWTFLERYRELREDQKSKIVLVMLTTSLNPDDKSRAESESAISGFRTKPLSVKMVQDIVTHYFPNT
ncbi:MULTISPECIES: response regulator [unclassified Imperialibacter]|uniref:response regulator n=1 Tax=unclassified Imperialibacter TaxID=2629706 RepID=UPI001253B363|nr:MULTISPECIES: response regulator [unclassified Imperialibacter]CAD5274618.1 Response regulator [Imperialibacter sp. 89]CAD5283144.1 Response regulator [Imperialibacter sp. 75]VVT22271.1 Response regulator [Imperialibacter sp. EC-SDR9]